MRNRKYAFLLLAVALLTSVTCQSSHPRPDEAYAVYSAYLEPQMLHNAHDYGAGGGVVLIQQMTSTLELQADAVDRIAENLKGVQASTLANFKQVIHETGVLEKTFSLPGTYALTSHADTASGKVKGDYGYIALSRVGFNGDRTQALFHIDHFCPLCGGSGYVLMKKSIFGAWKIQSEFFTIVS